MKWMNQKLDVHNNKITIQLNPKYDSSILPIDTAIKTVKNIVKNYPAPYTLLIGSSICDQAMIYAWSQANVRFTVMQPYFTDETPSGYGKSIKALAKKLRINIVPHFFDLKKFFEFECVHWANSFRVTSPQLCAKIKMMSSIEDGTIIMSGSILDLEVPAINYDNLGLYRYAFKSKKSIIPFFFLENEELAFSFWPTLEKLNNTMPLFERKIVQFTIGGFDLEIRDNDQEALDNIEAHYGEMFKDRVEEEYLGDVKPLDRIFKIPLLRKFKNPTIEFKILDSEDRDKN
jgi:hypothetical protein